MPATTHAQTSSAKRSAIDTKRDMTGMLKIEVRDNGRRCGTTRNVGERVTTVVFGGRCRVRFLSLRTPGQI